MSFGVVWKINKFISYNIDPMELLKNKIWAKKLLEKMCLEAIKST